MDAELKAKWVAALRSGKYEQGPLFLRNGESYCCLGVLCDVLDPNGWPEDHCLALTTLDATGLSGMEVSNLVHLNDTLGYPFNTIADWVEANL